MATLTHTQGDTLPLVLPLPADATAATLQIHAVGVCIEVDGVVNRSRAYFAPTAADNLMPGRVYRTTARTTRADGTTQTIDSFALLILEGCGSAPPAPSGIILSGALVEAGTDMATGSASVGISLSAAMAEDGSDTASGSLSIVAPGAITLSGALVEAGADTASGAFSVSNTVPTSVMLPDRNVMVGDTVDLDTSQFFSDTDGDPLTFTASGLPNGLLVSSFGLISGVPETPQKSTVVVTASDGKGGSSSGGFTMAVMAADPPMPNGSADYFTEANTTIPWYSGATGPAASYVPGGNSTVITWQTVDAAARNRRTDIIAYDHSTRTWGEPITVGAAAIVNDDHGVPAVCVTRDGYIVVFWGLHNASMFYAVSNSPNTIANGFTRYSLNGVEYTYWRPIARPDGGIDLFCRARRGDQNRMTLVYRKVTFAGSAPEMGSESTVVDFGDDSRAYSGNAIRGDDGRIWMVASRSNYADVVRKGVYLFRIDPDAGQVLTLAGESNPFPLSNTQADSYKLYAHDESPDITGHIPAMARDSTGRLHISYNVGATAGIGGTTATSPQEVWHIIINGTSVSPPVKIADLDQRYEGAQCVPEASGAMGIYYPSLESRRGGGILRRVIPAGSMVPNAVETIKPYDPSRHPANEIQAVLNAHPELRIAFAEVSSNSSDTSAAIHRFWAYGDLGYVVRALPATTPPVDPDPDPPTQPNAATDTFTTTSATDITSYVGESGKAWVAAGSTTGIGAVVEGGVLRAVATGDSVVRVYARPDGLSPNQFAEAHIRRGSSTNSVNINLAVRIGTNGCYWARYQPVANEFHLGKTVSGANTTLKGQTNSNAALSSEGNTAKMRLEVSGSTLTLSVNGTVVFTHDDTSLTAGEAGVRVYCSGLSVSGIALLDFTAGNL